MTTTSSATIAVAGATGYIGQAARCHLAGSLRVIALTCLLFPGARKRAGRSGCGLLPRPLDDPLGQAHARALPGHGPHPRGHLRPRRGKARLSRILYLGGLIPEDMSGSLSRHLESRLEVERTLGSRGVPLTAPRASIVAGGSRFLLRPLPHAPGTRLRARPQARKDDRSLSLYSFRARINPDLASRTATIEKHYRVIVEPRFSKHWPQTLRGASFHAEHGELRHVHRRSHRSGPIQMQHWKKEPPPRRRQDKCERPCLWRGA